MRIIIAADNASARFGGEAFIPLNYFRLLLARKEDVRLVVHARNKSELSELFPNDLDRLYFADDTMLHKALFRSGRLLPRRLADATTGLLIHLSTQFAQRRIIRHLVRAHDVDVVHVPIPVSPKAPSLMWELGTAVVIGPLNGGMEYPEAFRRERSKLSRLAFNFGRSIAHFVNALIPGILRAEVVIVANQRTREALPRGITGHVVELVENGVDFSVWQKSCHADDGSVRFIFIGRLIDWKVLDVVLEAICRIYRQVSVSLEVVGDGPMRESWQTLADQMGLGSVVTFSGWLSQSACATRLQRSHVLVLPSLFECGGAVVLEAMAMGLPVIATDWGGPADYLDESCGILVKPSSREALVDGFASAMQRLAQSPELRARLGDAGYKRAREHFDWEHKINQILKIYELAGTAQRQV
ncbi:glycosyltransferase family 4 protein [Bradyrhizobium sp.]|uniref:glycosyltransferase family 4 protein n=1 Tax=Bradyrhizobium sp. TaxID=376 RepID=UPI003BAFF33D